MPRRPANGARTTLRAICASMAFASAVALSSVDCALSTSACAIERLCEERGRALERDLGERAASARGGELRALDARLELDEHLAPRERSEPDSKWMRDTVPAASLLTDDALDRGDAADGGERSLPGLLLRDGRAHGLRRRPGLLVLLAGGHRAMQICAPLIPASAPTSTSTPRMTTT